MEEVVIYCEDAGSEEDFEPPRETLVSAIRSERWLKGELFDSIMRALEEKDEDFIHSFLDFYSLEELESVEKMSRCKEYQIDDDEAARMSMLISQVTHTDLPLAGLLRVNQLATCCMVADWEDIEYAVGIYRGLVEGGFVEDVDMAEGPDGEKYCLPIEALLFLRE